LLIYAECDGERILKLGWHLLEMEKKNFVAYFWNRPVYMWRCSRNMCAFCHISENRILFCYVRCCSQWFVMGCFVHKSIFIHIHGICNHSQGRSLLAHEDDYRPLMVDLASL